MKKNETGESGASQASRHGICCDGTPDEPWKSDRSCEEGTASYYLVWTLFGVSFTCINLYLLISSYFLTESRFSLWKLVKMAVQVLFYALGITTIY